MAIPIGSNFDLKSQLPIDERMIFDSLSDMKSFDEKFLPSMFICQVKETGKVYTYNVSNPFDGVTGRWREMAVNRFEFSQPVASTTWNITHSLNNWHPSIRCFDENSNEIYGDINYYSQNMVIITFCEPVKGTCYIQ